MCKDTLTNEIYTDGRTRSLHDALPICKCNDELIILSVSTLQSGLGKKDKERFRQWQKDMFAKSKAGTARNRDFSQTPQPVYPVMTNRHDAVMKSLIYNFEHPEAGDRKSTRLNSSH